MTMDEADGADAANGRGVDTAAIRRDYELGIERIDVICARHGITEYRLRRLREQGGWTARTGAVPQRGLPSTADRRLNALVSTGIGLLERRMADEGLTKGTAELLGVLCRAREARMRAKRNEKAAKARETKTKDEPRDHTDDPAWIRAELERRILRIRAAAGLEG
jgi:hypothetical protein